MMPTAKLSDLELWGTDIGNTHLSVVTTKKAAFITGKWFGECAGHTLLAHEAQCRLQLRENVGTTNSVAFWMQQGLVLPFES